MDFAQAENYLLGTINETVSRRMPYRLERMRAFLRALGNPQDRYPTVHIGGTSGKGSTSTMVASVLQASGKRVGLHTKPHLRSMTERARVDGIPIDEAQFGELISQMMPAIERTAAEHGRPTYYETLLALALTYFAEREVDVAVVEVGLGGRLDGTNVIVPAVAAITSIGYDHMDVLGSTLEEIAAEKAGIAKPGVPLVIAVDDLSARKVVVDHATQVGTPVTHVEDSATITAHHGGRFGQSFDVKTASDTYHIESQVLGEFQRRNASTAIVVLESLPSDLRPTREQIERGFAQLTIPGRMEVFPGHPTVVFDIAHNAEKAAHLAASLRETFDDRHCTFVVAIGESKDAAEILRALAALPSNFVFTTFETAGRHATKPQRLASIAESVGSWGRVVADPVEALTIARRNASTNDVVVVTGSTFIVAELRAWWLEHVADTSSAR
jgi:dihydrofolate synthase/folylpolyglutamate synthase